MHRIRSATGEYGDWEQRQPSRRVACRILIGDPPVVQPVSVLEGVFAAEILAIGRQLVQAKLVVDVLTIRMDRAVASYNAAQPREHTKAA